MSNQLNPLEVEQRYQELLLSLSLPATPYQRLASIASFLGFLGNAAAVYESHVIDVAERFRVSARALTASGHAPALLEQIRLQIEAGFRQCESAMETPGVAAGLDRLKHLSALASAFVAGWEGMFRVLGCPVPDGLDLTVIPPGGDGLRAIGQAVAPSDRALREECEELRRLLLEETEGIPHAAWFPVIERLADAGIPHSGALRQVNARIYSHSAEGHDSITADVAVLGVEHAEGGLTDIPMRAVRVWLRRSGAGDEEPMIGQVSFGGAQALHEGNSSDLAVAAVLACAVLRHNNERQQYRVRAGVAFTGGLDAEGSVLPVDGATLRLKVEAAFHSPVAVLVVPRGQTDEAESHVQVLRSHHPRRTLEIVGVRTLSDVFYDLRVIEPDRASLAMHAVRMVWRRKSRTVALVSSTVLLLLGGWYILGRLDRDPMRVTYEGDRLMVMNRYGAAIATIQVGEATVIQWDRLTSPWDPQHGYAFADVDGDGMKDIIYAQNDGSRIGGSTELIARSLKDDRRLWARTIAPDYDFPERPDTRAGFFNINDLVVGDVDADSIPDLFVASSHTPSFPGMVQRLALGTGTVLQTYVSTGHMADITLADLDGDGSVELFMCGTNNAFNRAYLAMVDANAIDGCSPHTAAYRCIRPSTGIEKGYALLPRSILGATLGVDQKGNGALFVRVDSAHGEVTVCVNDNKGNVTPVPVKEGIILNFVFDRAMNPVTIMTGDSYDQVASWAVGQGLLSEDPSPAYRERLKKQIRLWRRGVEVSPEADAGGDLEGTPGGNTNGPAAGNANGKANGNTSSTPGGNTSDTPVGAPIGKTTTSGSPHAD